jgi:EAL domain-containing protein (putative c-di-GMP-specific phosphodiesterase class I)
MIKTVILRRAPPAVENEGPAVSIARALHRRLPERLCGAGTLYLWLPEGRSTLRAVRALRLAGRDYELVEACARVPLAENEVQVCTAELSAALGELESEETRALFMPGPAAPRLPDFSRMSTLHSLDVLARSGWILDQLAEGRFTSWFHPIAHAQDTSRIFGHEALLRGIERDGSFISPSPIFSLAREAGLLFEVDSAACRSAIREAARTPAGGCVFINFSPASIRDPQANLRATLKAIEEVGLARDRVVFEVVEADRLGETPHLETVLRSYREAGLRVALDDLGAGWSTLNMVHRLRPDFIKLDRELIRGVHLDPVKSVIAGKLIEIGRELHIGTIVEGVEEEAELAWARDHGADYVQGFLLGQPRPVERC